MKKLISFLIISVVFISCGMFKTLDLSKLRTGMTKEQVVQAVGDPSRILAVNNTQNGYQEVLEYRTP
jgi:SmpA / OmlA family.